MHFGGLPESECFGMGALFFCFVCVCVCVYFNLCDQCFLFFGGERLKSEKK